MTATETAAVEIDDDDYEDTGLYHFIGPLKALPDLEPGDPEPTPAEHAHHVEFMRRRDWAEAEVRRVEREREREERVARLRLDRDIADAARKGDHVKVATLTGKSNRFPPVASNDNRKGGSVYPGIVSSAEFVSGFVPPDYHLDGVAQAGFLYALTAGTGTGKTAVLLALTASTALGTSLCGRDVRKGSVVYFAGENPDDVRMRWLAMADRLGFDPADMDVHFIAGTFSIPVAVARIGLDVDRLGGADMIVVDTSAAYFQGDDENGNTALGKHARDLRQLCNLPGKPAVFVACHPTKNADPANLQPRGGGAFIAEIDGNLTLTKDAGLSGKSASESSGALLQLSQAFSNGKVQAEEYNSLLDGAYPLLQAAAAGMQQAGGDVAKLTALVKDGKVSSEGFFRAIQAGAPLLEQKLAGASLTSAQAMEKLQNEVIKAAGEFDTATGFSRGLAVAIDGLAGSIGGVGTAASGAVNGVQALIAKVGELARANAGVQRQQGLTYQEERAARVAQAREMGTANAGGRETVATEQAAANARAAEENRKALASFRQSEVEFANALKTTTLPPARPGGTGKINPIDNDKYKPVGSKDGKGGGGSSKDTLDSYEKALVASEKRRQALLLEAETEGKGTFAKAKAREALELETAAKRAAIPITEEMRAAIDRAATGYANAKVRVEEVRKALEDAHEAQKFLGDAITDSLGDLIVDGEKAEDVMRNLVKQLARAALQAALIGGGPLAGLFGTSGSNGAPGGLLGMLFKGFADGGYVGAVNSDNMEVLA